MPQSRGVDRRSFLKSAVAIGGTAALGACLGREQPSVPRGPEDPATLPRRQHAWNAVLPTDEHGNHRPPRHHVLLYLDYESGGEPTDATQEAVERALRGVERAYEHSADGLLLTVGYSPAYFERFDAPLPESVDLPSPEALSTLEDPTLDTADAVVHLASNHASVVLGAEAALRGERDAINGIQQPDTPLTDVMAVADRRTGFVGEGLPAERDDAAGVPEGAVPEDAPLFMGFKSGFERNQASEDRITIREGPFVGGTTQHVSRLDLNLGQWYEQDDRWQRVAKMFCPHHAREDVVEGVGENLGDGSQIEECRPTEEAAREMGVVGHSQKTARARENDEPVILRRDFDSTDGGSAGLHFLALQRRIEDFVATREAMNGSDVSENSAVGQRNNNGILQYVRTERRGNFLLPPRPERALPLPSPASASGAGSTGDSA
jgi:hypothetical protein